MKIQSAHKDYYDFVAHTYGGGDPHNTYIRDFVIPDKKVAEWKEEDSQIFYEHEADMKLPYGYEREDGAYQYFRGISIAGKVYVVTRGHKEPVWNYRETQYAGGFSEPWKIAHYADLTYRKPPRYGGAKDNPYAYWTDGNDLDRVICCGVAMPQAVHLSKRLQAPVFIFRITDRGAVEVFGRCPLLKDYGIPGVLTPEQAYQEIAMFRMQISNQSPDSMPPAPMTSIQKVESHGFDKRISFRHRK